MNDAQFRTFPRGRGLWMGAVVAVVALVGAVASGCSTVAAVPRATAAAASSHTVGQPGRQHFANANASLVAITRPGPGLESARVAERSLSYPLANWASSGYASGPTMAALYSYSNSAAGTIRADGSVKLEYLNVAVWEFTVPLNHYVDDSQRPARSLGAPPTNCSYYYLVNARTGDPITNFEECAGN